VQRYILVPLSLKKNYIHRNKYAFILKFHFQCRRFTYFSICNPGRFSISEQEINHTQKFECHIMYIPNSNKLRTGVISAF
jgi:hypothetical protein